MTAIDSPAAASSMAVTVAASPAASRLSAVAPGTPASSAIPSLGPSSKAASPRSASSVAAGTSAPAASTEPTPASGPNACASCTISPALPAAPAGTAGTIPAARKSASRWHSCADTPASPARKVRSRTAYSARTSAGPSHGGPPVARPSSRWRWWARCCSAVSVTPLRAPMPVVTPYTGSPRASTCRAAAQDALTSWASLSPIVTFCPAEIRRIRSAFSCEAVSSRWRAGTIG